MSKPGPSRRLMGLEPEYGLYEKPPRVMMTRTECRVKGAQSVLEEGELTPSLPFTQEFPKMFKTSKSGKSNVSRVKSLKAELNAEKALADLLDKEDELNLELQIAEAELKKKKIARQRNIVHKELALEKSKIDEEDSDSISEFEDENPHPTTKVTEWKQKNEIHFDSVLHSTPKPKPCDEFQDSDDGDDETPADPVKSKKLETSATSDLAQAILEAIKSTTVQTQPDNIGKFIVRQTIKELPEFSGDPVEWPGFYEEYKRATALGGLSDGENLIRLKKCLKGEAKRLVAPMLIKAENLEKAIESLKDNFGDPELVVKTLIAKSKSVPSPTEDKPKSLIDFANSVRNLVTIIDALDKKEHLMNPQLRDELVSKLPTSYKMQWAQSAVKTTEVIDLKLFSSWLDGEAKAANLLRSLTLTCTKEKKVRENDKKPANKPDKRKEVIFATSENTSEREKFVPSSSCLFCAKKGHGLLVCRQFAKISLDDKWKWVREKQLCFFCFDSKHQLSKCDKKTACGEDGCQRFHHKILHSTPQEKNKPAETEAEKKLVGHQSSFVNSKTLLRVVPVTLIGPAGEINTYAVFDDCSTMTTIEDNLAKQLGLSGKRVQVCARWTNGTVAVRQSNIVSLKIRGKSSEQYSLTNVYTDDTLQLPMQSIDMDQMRKLTHLKNVDFGSYVNAKPKILIGQDNTQLTVARDVKEGSQHEPMATYTKLGWVVHGNLKKGRGIADKYFTCHIYHDSEMEEIHNLVKDSFRIEAFGVKVSHEHLLSNEDKRVLAVTDSTTKIHESRWETGLLWRTDDVQLPESTSVAVRRLALLEKKMDQIPDFAEEYCAKIDDYIKKGYARKLTDREVIKTSPKTWYLPHFGVYHPNKPGKLRLVFDAASKANGTSLNDTLLKGMDLLKPLTEVLFKFRQRPVAFKEMFHQVRIRDEDLDSQRFLWRGMDRHRPPDVMDGWRL